MGTSAIAVVFFMVILMLAATVAVLTVVYATRLPSKAIGRSRVAAVTGNKPDQAERPQETPAADLSSDIEQQPNALVVAGPASQELATSIESAVNSEPPGSSPSVRSETESDMKNIFGLKRDKATEQANVLPAEAAQTAVKPAPPTPNQEGTFPAPQVANVVVHAPANDAVQVPASATTEKENHVSTEAKPGTDAGNPARGAQVPSQAPGPGVSNARKSESKPPETKKSSMGDMSDLFAKATTEESKAGKLAEKMKDVDVNDLLKEGLGLVGRLKKK